MEFINAMDYEIKRPYEYIDELLIGGQKIDTKYLLDFNFESYGKLTIAFSLYPGVKDFINKVASFKQTDIIVRYFCDDGLFELKAGCEYDHFVIATRSIDLVFYAVDKRLSLIHISEPTRPY